MKMKFKKGDNVLVITGKDKGKTGAILKTSPSTNKVTVAGINVIKKAKRPNPQTGEEGGFVEKEAPIHASNVSFVDASGKPSRKRI
jgi:large subunit ribosomal protein L24